MHLFNPPHKIQSKTHRTLIDYMRDWVEFKNNYYQSKALRYKWVYWIMASVIAISAAIVPVLVNSDFNTLATIFSVVVSVGVVLQQIFHPRELWHNYALVDSNIRSEEMQFSMSAGLYADISDDLEKVAKFVQRIEELLKDETFETINLRTSVNQTTDKERLPTMKDSSTIS